MGSYYQQAGFSMSKANLICALEMHYLLHRSPVFSLNPNLRYFDFLSLIISMKKLYELNSHSMYSSLFSSVTRISFPPSFKSCVVVFPRISMSVQKYISRPHSSISFSLKATKNDVTRSKKYLLCFLFRGVF